MATLQQFEHREKWKKEQRKQKQRQEYLETKHGYKSKTT